MSPDKAEPLTGDGWDWLAESVASACQILAGADLVEHVLGHASVRLDGESLLIRCRGPQERGLAYTTADDVHRVTLDDGTVAGAWSAPNELPIHVEVMRCRPDVTAVVHAHPPAVVAMSLAGIPFRPIFGAYDIAAARLAADGIAVWPRACLVNSAQLGRELAGCLGNRSVAVLKGHGLVSVAGGPPERALARAVVQAVAVDSLARMSLAVHSAGGVAAPISAADLALLPDLGDDVNVDSMYRFLSTRTAREMRPCS